MRVSRLAHHLECLCGLIRVVVSREIAKDIFAGSTLDGDLLALVVKCHMEVWLIASCYPSHNIGAFVLKMWIIKGITGELLSDFLFCC